MLPLASRPGRPGVRHGGGIQAPGVQRGGGVTGVLESSVAGASWCQCGGASRASRSPAWWGRGERVSTLEPFIAKQLLLVVITGLVESGGQGLSEAQATQLRFHVHKLPLNLQGVGESVIHLEFIWQL